MRRTAVLGAALGLDLLLGEPPAVVHPVVWFGRLVTVLERRAPRGAPAVELVGGAALTALSLGLSLAAAWAVERLLAGRRGGPGRLLALFIEAWLLKTTLAVRALGEAAGLVRRRLAEGDLAAARSDLRSLVSRETAALSPPLVAAAAIESVAENASDGVIGPAVAYLAFGLPGAALYRGINTLDAMIGYHGAWEWLGKTAARLDDVVNLLPARLTAGLLVLAAALGRRSGRSAWRVLCRDRCQTASPNAGWPMSAMAGALGVELEKVGHYRLGAPARAPTAQDIDDAWALVRLAVVLGLGLLAGGELLRVVCDAVGEALRGGERR